MLRATPSWREPPPKTLIPWYWSKLGATCYAFVAGATSRIQNPNSIEAWELRATPLCGSHLQNPYPRILALWGRIIVHLCLWGVSMVLMRWWPLGSVTSMPIMWLFFPGYTWIKIVHDSEGSLIMDHGFCLWNYITRFYKYWFFIVIVFIFMEFKHIVSWNITHIG